MEHDIQNAIRAALAPYAVIFRANSGDFWQGDCVYSPYYRQRILINLRKIDGLPKGFSDLCGVRKSDGKAAFIEVKTASGRVSAEQRHFLETMRENNAIAGVARSPEDAIQIITEG